MIGLTAGIVALVGAMGIGFASVLPTLLICSVGPILTFRILHIIWLKMSRMFDPSKDKGVEVYDTLGEDYDMFVRRMSYYDRYANGYESYVSAVKSENKLSELVETYRINNRVSKNGKFYTEIYGDKFFPRSDGMFVITKEGGSYETDYNSFDPDDLMTDSGEANWYQGCVDEHLKLQHDRIEDGEKPINYVRDPNHDTGSMHNYFRYYI